MFGDVRAGATLHVRELEMTVVTKLASCGITLPRLPGSGAAESVCKIICYICVQCGGSLHSYACVSNAFLLLESRRQAMRLPTTTKCKISMNLNDVEVTAESIFSKGGENVTHFMGEYGVKFNALSCGMRFNLFQQRRLSPYV